MALILGHVSAVISEQDDTVEFEKMHRLSIAENVDRLRDEVVNVGETSEEIVSREVCQLLPTLRQRSVDGLELAPQRSERGLDAWQIQPGERTAWIFRICRTRHRRERPLFREHWQLRGQNQYPEAGEEVIAALSSEPALFSRSGAVYLISVILAELA